MKKHTEKQPIDDLFARKLSDMSMPPSPNGFERLQARMGQNKPEPQFTVWRNPSIQRYMAIAACLLLCLFGWLYLSSNNLTTPSGSQTVAVNQTKRAQQPPAHSAAEQSQPASITDGVTSGSVTPVAPKQEMPEELVAKAEKSVGNGKGVRSSTSPSVNSQKEIYQSEAPVSEVPILAQTKSVDKQDKPEAATTSVNVTNQSTAEQVADVKATAKPIAPAERVLVVTIDEPASLVAARQAAKTSIDEKPTVAGNDKPEKDARAGGLWAQVKRIKHGEVFAKRDNAGEEDRGLLDRAYSGLKHSFDKDKSAKQ